MHNAIGALWLSATLAPSHLLRLRNANCASCRGHGSLPNAFQRLVIDFENRNQE
jgi:hypothetical protein